jgi:hypothetical protein
LSVKIPAPDRSTDEYAAAYFKHSALREEPSLSELANMYENKTTVSEEFRNNTIIKLFGERRLLSGRSFDVLPMRLNPRVGIRYYGKLRQALNKTGSPGPFLDEIERIEKNHCSRFWNVLGLPMDSRLTVRTANPRLNTPLHNLIRDVDRGHDDSKNMESFLKRVARRDINILKLKDAQGDAAIDLTLTAKYDLRVSKLLVRQRRNSNVYIHMENLKQDFSLLNTGLIAGAQNDSHRSVGTQVKRAKIVRRQKPVKAVFNRKRSERLKVPCMSVAIQMPLTPLFEENVELSIPESTEEPDSSPPPSSENMASIRKDETTHPCPPCSVSVPKRPILTSEPTPIETLKKIPLGFTFDAKTRSKSRRRKRRRDLKKTEADETILEVKGPSLLRKMQLIYKFHGSKFYAVDWVTMQKLGPVYTSHIPPPCVSVQTALDSCVSGSHWKTLQTALGFKERTEPVPNVIPKDILTILLDRYVRMDVNKRQAVSRAEMCDAMGCSIKEINWVFEVTYSDDSITWNTFCLFWNMVSINYKSINHILKWIEEFDKQCKPNNLQIGMENVLWFPDAEIYYLGF